MMLRAGLLAPVLILAGPGILPASAKAAPCTVSQIGVDAGRADSLMYAYLCRGVGQVFFTLDTAIHSITVWRPAEPDSDAQPRRLFITAVYEESGVPRTSEVFFASPPLVVGPGDGIQPVAYRFDFDPPLILPKPGRYFLDVQADALSVFGLLTSTRDLYKDGQAWSTGPEFYCDTPGGPHDRGALLDLAFNIGFCVDLPTNTTSATWGHLKLIYR